MPIDPAMVFFGGTVAGIVAAVSLLLPLPAPPGSWEFRARRAEQENARLQAMATAEFLAHARADLRVTECLVTNDKLAREVSALGRAADQRDEALNKLDEVAQRLESCTCGVGRAIAEELDRAA